MEPRAYLTPVPRSKNNYSSAVSFKAAAPTGRPPQQQQRLLGTCWKYSLSSPVLDLRRTLWGGLGTCFHRREWWSRHTALGLTRRTPRSECPFLPRPPVVSADAASSDPEAPTPCATGRRAAAAKQREPAARAEGHVRQGRRPFTTLLASPSHGRGN